MRIRNMRTFIVYTLLAIALFVGGCKYNAQEKKMEKFISVHVAKIDPLSAESGRTSYLAEITGKKEYFDKLKELRHEMTAIYADRDNFNLLKELKDSGKVVDPILKRQLDNLYTAFLKKQIDPELQARMIDLDTAITERYNKFRGTVDGKEVTMSDIYLAMTSETDCEKREKVWLASKQVGPSVVDDLIKLIKLRNEAARSLGYDNWHTMAIETGQQNVKDLDDMFARLYELTNEPFAEMKAELDAILAENYGIEVDQLRPWHYHDPFFQRTPLVYELDLDTYYADRDVKVLAEEYFAGVGLPVDDILARSDLYDKPGKNPHAFAQDIDRHGDVRVLCNINNDERWMETTLHELGHAIYSKYHDPDLPYLLRQPAHSFTTEAVAMFFGRLSRNPAWLQQMLDLPDDQTAQIKQVADKYMRFQQILFSRWAMVMYNFEKALYADPDQDLNNLWWQLVKKYQFVNPPDAPADAGWASKLHFTVAPCYYHNYMLGELFASQLHNHIVTSVLALESDANVSYVNQPKVGEFIRENVLAPSDMYHWNEMIERAMGKPLSPDDFVKQFVN